MPVIPLLRIKFYTMYQKAQDNFILGFCHHWKEKYDWQDTHFVIHLETDSIYITKNLVCKFPFLELEFNHLIFLLNPSPPYDNVLYCSQKISPFDNDFPSLPSEFVRTATSNGITDYWRILTSSRMKKVWFQFICTFGITAKVRESTLFNTSIF